MLPLKLYLEKRDAIRAHLRTEFGVTDISDKRTMSRVLREKEEEIMKAIYDLSDSPPTDVTQIELVLHCLFALAHWRKWGPPEQKHINRVRESVDSVVSWSDGQLPDEISLDIQRAFTDYFNQQGEYFLTVDAEFSFDNTSHPVNRALYALNLGLLDFAEEMVSEQTTNLATIVKLAHTPAKGATRTL